MNLTTIKGIGFKTASILTKYGYNLDNIENITVEDLIEMDFSEKQSIKMKENIKKFFKKKEKSEVNDKTEDKPKEIRPIETGPRPGRYRLKKQLKRKFPEVDVITFKRFFRTNANKYDNIEDMTEAFKIFKEK